METKNKVTGRMFVRHQGNAPTNDGRKLIMVCAILAIPEEAKLHDESMYTISGTSDGRILTVIGDGDMPAENTRGMSAGGIFTAPIWRV